MDNRYILIQSFSNMHNAENYKEDLIYQGLPEEAVMIQEDSPMVTVDTKVLEDKDILYVFDLEKDYDAELAVVYIGEDLDMAENLAEARIEESNGECYIWCNKEI